MLRVKILCTIGPASRDIPVLRELIQSGMNVARLNMSHGTHEYHSETIDRIRMLSEELGKPIAILADLQGPKLRVGKMQEGGVPIDAGDDLILTAEEIIGGPGRVPIQYKDLPRTTKPGEIILLDDGLLELRVERATDTEIFTKVVVGGVLNDNKGMNLPHASLDIGALTEKDREDVKFALDRQVDWIALSFVRRASDVIELREIIQRDMSFGRITPIISKIEKPEAVKNIDEIIAASDAIMVARGDLGIETSPEAVPMVQKMIIAKCHAIARPVITATQMLDSMIRNPRPTRAEASDVANAVLDGSDAIMLSGETASGMYPVQAVKTMVKIAEEAERVRRISPQRFVYESPEIFSASGAICHAAVQTAHDVSAKAIVAPTVSGNTAKLIAAFRPRVPVIAVTPSPMVQRRLCLHWGIYSLLTRQFSSTDEVVVGAVSAAQKAGYLDEGDTIILTAGMVGGVRSATNLMMVHSLERVLATGTGIGQREIVGRIMHITPPVNGELNNVVSPQDIIFTERVDRTCLPLLQRAGGLITQESGLDSMGAIFAMELNIPALIGVQGHLEQLVDGEPILLDTNNGQVSQWRRSMPITRNL
ncbi:MAG: pyruvate kinase [Caldilineaceae bacterium]|nr:pyruvate kinase [Caldilineaceae bacterium]